MKIAVTGATGFVGRQLVPLLAAGGATLLLVGRDADRIRRIFPAHAACSYQDLESRASGFDVLVHMATVNTRAGLSLEETRKVNVALLADVVHAARRAGIPAIVNMSSIHALRETDGSAYARTKREAAQWLREAGIEGATTIYLPPIYGERWSGKLALLNRLPGWLARSIFPVAAALGPTLHVERLARFILSREIPRGEVVLTDGQDGNIVYQAVKRAADIAFALLVFGFFWWLLAAIWIVVRLQSPGPAIFAQKRIGRFGSTFTCYKFRSMKIGTIEATTNQVSSDAVTAAGVFLRRFKLDELPQAWNILRNELSLVGPRPSLVVQHGLIEARAKRGVLDLKPGMTGYSQIRGIDMSDPEKLAASDARYLALQGLVLDARILIATAWGRGNGDRVATAATPGLPVPAESSRPTDPS